MCEGGQGGRRSGEKGAGGGREAGEEGAGSGISKVAGSGRKRENYATLHNISQSKKCKGVGAKKYRAGTGIKGYGSSPLMLHFLPCPHLPNIKKCHHPTSDLSQKTFFVRGQNTNYSNLNQVIPIFF